MFSSRLELRRSVTKIAASMVLSDCTEALERRGRKRSPNRDSAHQRTERTTRDSRFRANSSDPQGPEPVEGGTTRSTGVTLFRKIQ
jgi:hypothetical protein